MTTLEIALTFAVVLTLSGWTGEQAHAAPGEDPLFFSNPVHFDSAPGARFQPSGNMDASLQLPAWMKAKMTRYTAKAFSATADDGSIYTDSDVINTTQSNGFKTTCVQEVGSVSGDAALGTRYGPGQRDQIVVLRGDLVNICK
jgi:hypothetical protein